MKEEFRAKLRVAYREMMASDITYLDYMVLRTDLAEEFGIEDEDCEEIEEEVASE